MSRVWEARGQAGGGGHEAPDEQERIKKVDYSLHEVLRVELLVVLHIEVELHTLGELVG